MAIRIRRSAVPGKSPQLSDLELGELALNTYDGVLYTKKNNGSESIVQLSTPQLAAVAASGQYTDLLGKPVFGNSAFLNVGSTAGTVAAGNDSRFSELVARLDGFRDAKRVYVSPTGDDENNGSSLGEPLQTLGAAAAMAQPGDLVVVGPGVYTEASLPIRWKRDVGVLGSGLRNTTIRPAPGQEMNGIFKVDSGFWCWGLEFAGHQANSVNGQQSWAISFNELANNSAIGAIGLGAYILKSPYIQNCSSITAEDDSGTAGSQSLGDTGGGILVDGSKCAINSPIRSMVVDSYTQVNLGGPGCLVIKDGYAQLVSFFGTFCIYHVKTESGGQVNLSGGGTSDFGVYGLVADGYSPSPIFSGKTRVNTYGAARIEKTVTIDVSTDVFTCASHGLSLNDQITFSATEGLLPDNLTYGTTYYVIDPSLNTFKVSTSLGGAAINMTGSATGTYQFTRQGATEVDVVGFSANRLGRQIKYPTAGSLGSPGNSVPVLSAEGSTSGSKFTVQLSSTSIKHEYVGGGTLTVNGTSTYSITSAEYNNSSGLTVLSASGYAPNVGHNVALSGLSFICDSASRPNAGQLMFPQLVFPRNSTTGAPQAKTFPYNRVSDFILTYSEVASPSGPDHEYVSGGTVTIGGSDYGVANADYNKYTGLVTITTKVALPVGSGGNATVSGLSFICPTSAYVVTSSVPIKADGSTTSNSDPLKAGYRVLFYSSTNGGLKDSLTSNQVLDFRNRSQISAPSHTFEYVGAGTNYDALPWNGGVPIPANKIVTSNNGRVYSSNTDELGNFKVGDQFEVDGTTGSVTINTDQFNLSGLNFIGPFSRNGGISTVGEQLREVSNNTSLIASTGAPDGNTTPTQFAVKSYSDNKFLSDVTVTAGQPVTVSDTSTQDVQGFWSRKRNINLSLNVANGLVRLNSSGIVPSTLLPSTDSISEGTTNLYFTQSRARQSITTSGSPLSYDSATGTLTYTTPSTGPGSGSVTSVGLSLPSGVFSVTNSPVTSSGTLTATLSSQAASLVLASPTGGGTPQFRQLGYSELSGRPTLPTGSIVGTTDTQTLTGKTLGSITESVFAITDSASVDLNPANGPIQTWTLGASRTATASSFPSGASMLLAVAGGTTKTLTWPTITWVGNTTAPTIPDSGYVFIQLWKIGTTLYGAAQK